MGALPCPRLPRILRSHHPRALRSLTCVRQRLRGEAGQRRLWRRGVLGAQQLAQAVLSSASLEVFSKVPMKRLRADALTELDLNGDCID